MAWTPSRNRDFASKCFVFAQMLRQAEDQANDIYESWFANAVSGDANFEPVGALSEQDMTDAVTLAEHFRFFVRNGDVATADRASTLARIAGGPLEG
jgi:hypothetical protein